MYLEYIEKIWNEDFSELHKTHAPITVCYYLIFIIF